LTILVQILRNIEFTTIISNPEVDLNGIIKHYMDQYISEFSDENLINSQVVHEIFDKLNQVIIYYNTMLNNLILVHNNDEEAKIELIKNRMKDLSLTMDIDKYKFLMFDEFNFRKALRFCTDDPNISADQLYNNAISILPKKGITTINKMYNYLQKIKNSEKNIFIIWHLFAFARMRIRSFILFYKQYPNYYDNILENIWQLMIQQFPNYLQEKISILSYIKAYDELEIKANNWMEILKQLSIFQRENVHFEYYGIIHTREKMLMSLQEAENSGDNIIFSASFNPDTDVIVHSHHRLLYLHFATDGVLTSNECYTIFGKYYSNTQQTFYQLFEGLDIEIQKKLEQIIINPFLVDEMSLNQEEYLQENTQNLGYGQVMSTQKRHGLVQFILNGCNLIVKQGNY
uniref:Uncharacterized protein n=1 Tax=Meloidogyne floridensis TaxID=298350 RepID=A0A915PA33_9BILA